MAGWLVVWTRAGARPDAARWARSTRAAVRYGGTLREEQQGRSALAAWRRDGGEFPASGTLASAAGARVAWIGQCVDDGGDASADAIAVAAAEPFDADRAARLNGPFAAVVLRDQPFEARVLTDRHRHYPVYLYRGPELTVASTELRCLVPWLERAELEPDAVDMLLRCGELIDRQTLLRGVEMLPPGTLLRDAGQGSEDRRYWSMRSDAAAGPPSTPEQLAAALRRGVRRLEAVSPRLGITLSGGLDSRIILDLAAHPERVPSFTWGLPGCRDIVCATRYATLVGSPHTVRTWEPEAFVPLWSRGVDLTGGACGIDSMFMLPFVPLLASACDVVFNGLAGDVVLGGNWVQRAWLAESDAGRLGRQVWRWRVPEAQDRLVDRMTARATALPSAGERWAASIAARAGGRPVERLNDWLVENRIFRTTNCGTMLLRGGVESHAPFFDNDFVDLLVRVDHDRKFKHRLYLEVMNRAAPRAASVAWQRTNVSPARGYHANLAAMAFQRAAATACKPFGVTPFADLQVADLPGWLRGPWRKPVEGLILDQRFLQRGLVDADVVRETWQAHAGGVDHSRQISVLVALELFARLMLDEAPA
ncbi:MAG: asparagine synthase-related protein [Caldimonas sp.]